MSDSTGTGSDSTTTTWSNTLIGPLTTTFTPPSTCISDIWVAHSTNADNVALTWLNLGPTRTSVCLPSGWGPSAYYSPALCPSGYSANVVSTVDSETQAVCCPSYDGTTYSLRPQTSLTYTWYETELCQTQPASGTTTFPMTNDEGGGTTKISNGVIDADDLINAYGISIRWKERDFPASTSATSTATATSTTTAATDTSAASTNKSSGLSDGAKAGIGVGVAVGALLIIGLFFFLFRRRRGKKVDAKGVNDHPRELSAHDDQARELSAHNNQARELSALNQKQPTEVKTDSPITTVQQASAHSELENTRYELDGNGR